MKRLCLFLLCLVMPTLVWAQAVPVQQAPARLDAAAQVSTSATTGATITLTPNANESVYIYEIDINNCAGATAVTPAAVTTITTTGLAGSPAWTMGSGTTTAVAGGAGACAQTLVLVYPTGLKSNAAGTAVTFVLPTFAGNQTIRVNVAWRTAP